MQNVIDLPDAVVRISGDIIATSISYAEFLDRYGGIHAEWVNGVVIQMSPVSKNHDALSRFLEDVFSAYLGLTGGGRVLQEPMVMKPKPHLPGRAPDLQILLPDNLEILQDNQVAGAADLVVEIVSPESDRRDRVEKFREYEQGGVKEYWIIDPIHQEALFYCLNAEKVYQRREPDAEGVYHSLVLNRLKLPLHLLWADPLPDFWATARLVETMLQGAS